MFLDIQEYTLNKPYIFENSFISYNFDESKKYEMDEFSVEAFNNIMKTSPFTNENEEDKNIEFNVIKDKYFEEENYSLPELFSFNKVKDLLLKNLPHKPLKLIEKAPFSDENFKSIEISISDIALLAKKRRRRSKLKQKEELKKGRKLKEDTSLRKHNKYSADNIIKKIKRKLLEYFLKMVNKVINKSLDSTKLANYYKILRPFEKKINNLENLLKIIDYKYIDRLNKKIDLLLLNMPFKEIFSKEITPRFSKLKTDSNKIIIKKLLEEEKDNDNLSFVLNLKFRDWLDIFTYKKEINSIKSYEEKKMTNIKNSFEYADKIIMDIYNTNHDSNYLLYFLIYLYNYERWFLIKRGRLRKINKNKK